MTIEGRRESAMGVRGERTLDSHLKRNMSSEELLAEAGGGEKSALRLHDAAEAATCTESER